MITLTNTLTGKPEIFYPKQDKTVALYVCGITPYDRSHLGHGRCYVTFDVLVRVLQFLGYTVTYCRNFTDIDDKLIKKAEQILGDKFRYLEIAQQYIDLFQADVAALNCLQPTMQPRVTDHIPDIIILIQKLIDTGYAYVVNNDVYYHIAAFPEYGRLSKHSLADLRAGARVDVREQKKDPLDFALWKGEAEGTFFKSPWGWGRPGWHIECSAMAARYLGTTLDIHGGGMDLIFPHHENEIAQSQAAFAKPLARFWVHNGFVMVNKEKMSKSLGNVFVLQEVFKEFDPMVVRFYFLNHSYRAPLDYSIDELKSIEKGYQRLVKQFQKKPDSVLSKDTLNSLPVIQKMIEFLYNDLNTVGMLGYVFEHINEIMNDEKNYAGVYYLLHDILGLTLQPVKTKEVVITPEIQKLLDERELARAQKDWQRADAIRDQLREVGVEIQDKKSK